MKLVEQWRTIEAGLPAEWDDARLELTTEQESDLSRAAQILSAIGVGKSGSKLVFQVHAAGGSQGPQVASRLFEKLDRSRIWCELTLGNVANVDAPAAVEAPGEPTPRADPLLLGAATSWDHALAPLPSDWTDLLCELDLESSDDLDRTALLCAPLNPSRDMSRIAFTFRCSGRSGYGVSRAMARRCFERLDAEGIPATATIVRVLSDTDNVDTQGPVWLVGGKTL